MDRVVRPGGLTAFSILNFIFGGIQAFGVLFSLLALGCAAAFQTNVTGQSTAITVFSLVMDTGIAVFLIISGVGCLKGNNISGRWFGNLYAVFAIVKIIIVAVFGEHFFSNFSMFTILGLVYPVLLLVFLNLVFRDIWADTHPVFRKGEKPGETKKTGRNVPPLFLVCFNSYRQTLRSFAGILLCMTIMIVGLFTAQLVLLPVEIFVRQAAANRVEITEQELVEQMEQVAIPILSKILGAISGEELPETPDFLDFQPLKISYVSRTSADLENPKAEQWAYYLLRENPGVLSLLFILLVLIIPGVIIFSGFNQISGDSKNKGLRYLLMRAKRRDIFIGKFLGSMIITVIMLFILIVSVILYMQLKLGIYDLDRMVRWGMGGFGMFILLALPYIALSVTFSGLIDSPVGSLGASLGVLALFPLFAFFLQDTWKPLGALQYLLPLKMGFFLFHYEWWWVLFAALAMIGYAAVYLSLGFLYFRKRNL